MKDADKTKEQLISELEKLRRRNVELEKSETERKLVGEALQKSDEKFRSVFDLSPQAIALTEVDSGMLIAVNDKFCEVTQYSREEVIGRTTTESRFYSENDRARFLKELRMSGEVHGLEMDFKAKDGSDLHTLMFARTIEIAEKTMILTIFHDMTDRKQTESILRDSEERFRSLVETAASVILCLSPDYRITEFNPEAERLYGYKREEVLGKDYLKLFVPEAERDAIAADIKKVLSGEPTKGFENPVLAQDGSEHILMWNVNRLLDSQNRPIGIIADGQDITERKKMEEVLRLTQFAIDHSSDAAFWMGSDARFFYVNDAACRALGYTREELLAMTVHDIDPDFPREIWPEHWAAVKHKGSFVVASRHRTKDGRIFPVEISVNYLEFGGKEYNCAFARDITKRKQTEELNEKLSYLKETLLGTGSLDEKIKVITDGIVEVFEADFARVWIIREGDLCDSGCFHAAVTEGPHVCRSRDRCLHLTASSGRYTHLDGSHGRVPFGCYKIGRVAAGEDAKFLTNDVTNDPRVHDHDWAAELGLVSFGGYRLLAVDGVPIGVLAFFSKQVVSRDEDALLEDLANTTAQVIQTGMVEEALKASQAKYQDLYDNAPDMFASVDAGTGKIVECNQTVLKSLGYSKEEVIGRNIAELYHPDCEEVRKKAFKTFIETGEVHEAEL